MLIISVVAIVKSTTAKDKLGLSSLSVFFALMSILAVPGVVAYLAEIAKVVPHNAGGGILIAIGFIIITAILMTILYSSASTEDEVMALFNKAPNLSKWFVQPPHKHKVNPTR
jgi:hypothetical protein